MKNRGLRGWKLSVLFFTLVLIYVIGVNFLLLSPLTHLNPLTWLVSYLWNSTTAMFLFGYWLLVLLVGITLIVLLVLVAEIWSLSVYKYEIRKYFHLLAVLIFVPGIITEVKE